MHVLFECVTPLLPVSELAKELHTINFLSNSESDRLNLELETRELYGNPSWLNSII